MKHSTAVYLALFLLVIMVLYSKREGFEGHDWLGLSGWFTNSDTPTTTSNQTTISNTGSSNTGTGSSGTIYETTTDTSNDLTSSEKTIARSALTKLIAQNEGDEVLLSCINKIKVKL